MMVEWDVQERCAVGCMKAHLLQEKNGDDSAKSQNHYMQHGGEKHCPRKYFFFISILSAFSFTDTDEKTFFLSPFYHFHPLTNMQTFICNFACQMTTTYFNRSACIYHTATR